MDKKTIIMIAVFMIIFIVIIFGVMYYMNKISEQNKNSGLKWTPITYQSPMASFTDALMPDNLQLF